MLKVTEIIPDNLPEWAQEAMDAGQFFKAALEKVDTLEKALNDLLNDCINFDGGKLSDCMLKQASDALNPQLRGRTQYHVVESCNKCKGENKLLEQVWDNNTLHAAATTCLKCGFEDYWAHGWFQSGSAMASNCDKDTT